MIEAPIAALDEAVQRALLAQAGELRGGVRIAADADEAGNGGIVVRKACGRHLMEGDAPRQHPRAENLRVVMGGEVTVPQHRHAQQHVGITAHVAVR